MGNSEARLHKGKTKEKQKKLNDVEKGLNTRLEKLEVKNRPKELTGIKLDFSLTNPPQNKVVIAGDDFNFCYGQRKLFSNAAFNVYNGMKQAIIGRNGIGKTTLLNQIYSSYRLKMLSSSDTVRDNCINIVPKAVIGYFCQGFENLDFHKTVLENVMQDSVQNETTARTILARLLLNGDNVYKKVGVLSGGERIKASFAKLIVSSANVLLLDEPTNYLDMSSINALQNILYEYEGTVLFVSHDKAFVNGITDRLLLIKNERIIEFEGNLEAYEEKFNNTKRCEESNKTQKMLLQMRIADVTSKISQGGKDIDKLEEEYRELISKINLL
jgi:macrolide transport system ATP-binding/permease protein